MSLELIVGPMFAGKTSALQSIIRRHEALGIKCMVFKPIRDSRYGNDAYIYNHDNTRIYATAVDSLMAEFHSHYYPSLKLIVIEEGQFFEDLYDFVLRAVEVDKKHVVVGGLDGDRFRRPFGQILQLIPLADRITKLTSLCKLCADGTPALFSYSNTHSSETIHIGGAESYIPVCRNHYINLTTKITVEDLPTPSSPRSTRPAPSERRPTVYPQ
jgi:thymidine kinase